MGELPSIFVFTLSTTYTHGVAFSRMTARRSALFTHECKELDASHRAVLFGKKEIVKKFHTNFLLTRKRRNDHYIKETWDLLEENGKKGLKIRMARSLLTDCKINSGARLSRGSSARCESWDDARASKSPSKTVVCTSKTVVPSVGRFSRRDRNTHAPPLVNPLALVYLSTARARQVHGSSNRNREPRRTKLAARAAEWF